MRSLTPMTSSLSLEIISHSDAGIGKSPSKAVDSLLDADVQFHASDSNRKASR